MTPSIGRIVHYTLTDQDADDINRRRAYAEPLAARRAEAAANDQTVVNYPHGAQGHVGNAAVAGDICPMIIVRVNDASSVNGQVLLDGSDTFWATSRAQGDGPGMWHEPPVV